MALTGLRRRGTARSLGTVFHALRFPVVSRVEKNIYERSLQALLFSPTSFPGFSPTRLYGARENLGTPLALAYRLTSRDSPNEELARSNLEQNKWNI